MKIDLRDIKVINVVNGIERPHTSVAGFNEHGDRLPYVVGGRSSFPSWETSNSSRIHHLVNKLLQAPCCPVSQRDSAFVSSACNRKHKTRTDRHETIKEDIHGWRSMHSYDGTVWGRLFSQNFNTKLWINEGTGWITGVRFPAGSPSPPHWLWSIISSCR